MQDRAICIVVLDDVEVVADDDVDGVVAIKVLPESFARDANRVALFTGRP